MEDVRIIAKGSITDLSKGFSLGGVPFSVYVRSKEDTMLSDTLLACRLIGDKGQVHSLCLLAIGRPQ